jgi:hypothetical protein
VHGALTVVLFWGNYFTSVITYYFFAKRCKKNLEELLISGFIHMVKVGVGLVCFVQLHAFVFEVGALASLSMSTCVPFVSLLLSLAFESKKQRGL